MASIETFSGWITDSSSGQIVLNMQIDKEIRAIVDWLQDQQPATKSRYTLKEWQNFVRSSFGDPLAALDLSANDEENGRKLKKAIEAAVDAAPKTAPMLFMTIGCTLFAGPLPAPLAIGSVPFETNAAPPSLRGRAERRDRDKGSQTFGARLRRS